MIELIIKTITIKDFPNESKNIDIAQGKNKLHLNFKDAFKQYKRKWL